MTLLHRARRLVWLLGIDVRRFPQYEPGYRRANLLAHHRIDHVFDIGASDGRYGSELRRFGYRGPIVSFEPLPSAYEELIKRAAKDPRWTALPYALGRDRGNVTLNVAGNAGASSSVLPILERHLAAEPSAAYVGTVTAEQYRLDDLWRKFARPDDRFFIKVDVQGYERAVLAGAAEALRSCTGIQVELSFVQLYEQAPDYREILAVMDDEGFELMHVEPGFTDPASGRTLQADAIFFRPGERSS